MATCCKTSGETTRSKPKRLIPYLLVLPFILVIRFYQYFISPMLGPKCRFEPSCSHYAEQSLRHHGLFKGLFLAVKRLMKCHPWHPGGYDPVPTSKHRNS